MSQKFQAAVHHRDDVTFVKLGGVIDEDNELQELGDKIAGGGTVVVDLGGIERINSCGVRDWVNWLNGIEAKDANVVLVECSPAIVAQINLVNNFTGNGVVKSFYVPYFCPECDEEKVLLVESADMGAPPHEPPVCRCDECDLVMDFDDMPDSYFAFLNAQSSAGNSNEVGINAIISEFSGEESEKKIRSRASGSSITAAAVKSSSSMASIPSLPSISRSNPALEANIQAKQSVQTISRVGGLSGASLPKIPVPEPRQGVLVYVLVGILIAAIAVLGILLMTS